MNTRNLIIAALMLLFVVSGFSQKRDLNIDDPYKNPAVYPQRLNQLQWVADANFYSYIENNALVKFDLKGKADTVLKLETVQKDFASHNLKSPKRFPQFEWNTTTSLRYVSNDSLFGYDFVNHKIEFKNMMASESEYVKEQSVTGDVAFTEGQNLFIYSKGKKITVTNDTKEGVVNGQTVARSEFGITHGIFWSPKGTNLAFYKKDESMVTNYPLVDVNARVGEVKNTRYAMAGMTNEKVDLCVYNLSSGKTITLKTDDGTDHFLTNISWTPDEKYILIAVLNRQQNHMWLNKYDAYTGDFVKTLFEETHPRYVEPLDPAFFLNGDNAKFVWLSQRDGFKHAYLYDLEGNMMKQLTKGNWLITEFMGFNADNSLMFFTSTQESPLQNHLYSLNMKSLKVSKLTVNHGTHYVTLSADKNYFFDVYSNWNEVAKEYVIGSADGKINRSLLKSINPLADVNVGEMTISTIKADDGTELYYRLIKPSNFDPKKKYPAIVYVYGGPHAQMITDSWLGGGGMFLQYLAAQGFVVFTVDNRGSANRGFEFESVIHRQLGKVEMRDQMAGIEFLKSLPYVDSQRIGVDGWSFGGFMSTSLKLNQPGTFKVAVAGGPVIDWKFYEIMYGERYMDTPEENAEGYENSSVLPLAKNLEGKLLIIHGTMDPTVVWQHSLLFIQECVNNHNQVDYFVYPGHEHNVRGMDRLHLETKIFEYFRDNL